MISYKRMGMPARERNLELTPARIAVRVLESIVMIDLEVIRLEDLLG